MNEGSGRISARDESRPWNRTNVLQRTGVMRREPVDGRVSDDTPASVPARSPHSLKLLRFPAVRERTGLSRSTVWRMERRGEFPRHYQIAPNAVGWAEHEISRWIEERVGG